MTILYWFVEILNAGSKAIDTMGRQDAQMIIVVNLLHTITDVYYESNRTMVQLSYVSVYISSSTIY